MPTLDHERIGIVGLGAIGGSLSLALKDRAPLLTWSRDQHDRVAAAAAGISVCRGDAWAAEMSDCTAVLVAVPLDEISVAVRELLPRVTDTCLVMHTASLQRRAALGLSEGEFRRVVGTHPIAGSERSGFAASTRTLFRDATIRGEARAGAAARGRIEMIWRATGASRFVWDDASRHDALMAWISHLPQLTATVLAAVLADRGVAAQEVGPGARDTTRLAASDPAMWLPLLEKAPPETVDALRCFTGRLGDLGHALEAHDESALAQMWGRARAWRAPPEDRT